MRRVSVYFLCCHLLVGAACLHALSIGRRVQPRAIATCMSEDTAEEERGPSRRTTAHEVPQLSPNRIRNLAEKINIATTAASSNDPWSSNPQLLSALALDGTWDIDPGTYAALLMNFKRRRAWRASVATLSHALAHEPHNVNARHFAMGISACGAARRHRDALRLLREMQRPLAPAVTPSVKPDLVCFNAALSACAAAGDHGAALQLLHTDIPAAGLRPDAYSYSATFSALGRNGKADEAAALLDAMERAKVAPTVVVASGAMTSLLRGGGWKRALSLFDDSLTKHGLQPDTVMYGTAMSAANAGHQWGRTLEFMDQLSASGLTPSQHCYSEALVACREAGQWNAAAQLHARLLLAIPTGAARQTADFWRGGVTPSQDATLSYNAILDAVPPGASREDRARVFAAAREAGAYTGLQRDGAPHDLDLHGLSVGAAQQAVLWWLTDVQAPLLKGLTPHEDTGSNATAGHAAAAPPERLTIITGRGKDSKHRQPWQRSAADGHGSSVREGVEAMLDEMQAPLVETDNSGTLVLDVANWIKSFGNAERRAAEFAPPPMPPPTQGPTPISISSKPPRAADVHAWEVVGGATSREIRLGPAPAARGVVHEMGLGVELVHEMKDPREVELHSSIWFEGSDARLDARARSEAQRAGAAREVRRERASSDVGQAWDKAVPRGAVEVKRMEVKRSKPQRSASRAVGAPPAAGGDEEAAHGASHHRQARRVPRRIVKRKSDGTPQHALARSPEKN